MQTPQNRRFFEEDVVLCSRGSNCYEEKKAGILLKDLNNILTL